MGWLMNLKENAMPVLIYYIVHKTISQACHTYGGLLQTNLDALNDKRIDHVMVHTLEKL